MITADGTSRLVSVATTVLRSPDGTVKGAVETFRDISSDESQLLSRLSASRYQDIITINSRMQKILETLPMIADSDSTVLLQGESGVGKELFARAIYRLSPRREKPFIAINCSALPDNLLESELFGHAAGAFTDAKKDKPGRFALAEGGVLFLDEIGDTSAAMQVKLLRVLQEKEYEPLGSVKSRKANVRIIAATNRDLEKMVAGGSFRKDLYYRLNVIRIVVPPLRERKDDLPLLADYFINKLNKQQHKQIRGIGNDAMPRLMAYDFPGNVRELENMIERAFVLCRKGYIAFGHLFDTATPQTAADMHGPGSAGSMKNVEATFLLNALERNNWERRKTAKELGMDRSTLYRKIRSLGIKPPPETENT
jgi:transcriptional regulator with PAS, ATPase and Fis domain